MTKPMNRRMFLRGAGGAALAIPFLPSLLSRAFASDPKPLPPHQCFFAIGTGHGGIWGNNMYPSDAVLDQSIDYIGRKVRYGNLPTTPDENGNVVFSPLCTASAQVMTPQLAQKFNLIRGLDLPYYHGHSGGIHLGNFGAMGSKAIQGISTLSYLCPTIDQFMAWSPSFYTAQNITSEVVTRSFSVWGSGFSQNWQAPSIKSGSLVSPAAATNNLDLFDRFFNPSQSLAGLNMVIVDQVKAHYDMVLKDPRLSSTDKMRLMQHVELFAQLENKLKIAKTITAPPKPDVDSDKYLQDHEFYHNPEKNRLYCALMNDIIVLAFSTGVSRVGSWNNSIRFAKTEIQDWHGNVGHQSFGAEEAQKWALGYTQGTFEHIMVDLAAKMDAVIMADGSTLLDNSLIQYTQEAGQVTHHGSSFQNYPVVTAGKASGYFKTGMFVDFSDKSMVSKKTTPTMDLVAQNPMMYLDSPGLFYNQYLGNVLSSMGIPKAEYEHFSELTGAGAKYSNKVGGYGLYYVEKGLEPDYAQAKLVMSDKLPVIT